MKSDYQVVVIGGGIVGCSLLYHLTLKGWTDVAVIERAELTAGSSWHAAGGFHAINSDARIAALQQYSIGLYPQVEAESGVSIGLKMTGGIELASTQERMQWLRAELEWHAMLGHDEARLVDVEEIVDLVPIVDPAGLVGGLFDPLEGNLDPNGATHAFAAAARGRGADVVLRNRVVDISRTSDGRWRLDTERGLVLADHVVNAAGLWARNVGRMVGVDHPVTPMQHHYLVTDSVPEIAALTHVMPAVTDMEGFTYLQREQDGVILGVYEENPKHWKTEGADWDFGLTLFPPDIERISRELQMGFARFPALERAGIKRWVNGAFTFTPDGNPLVGPVRGLPGYWAACGVMAGFSQGAAIGLALSNWIVDGDPGDDVFAMDVARFGDYAADDDYLRATTAQFYARRFVIAYPNEQLPAGRPVHTTPAHDLLVAEGAVHDVTWGLEVPQYFAHKQPNFAETPSLGRNNAFGFVADEVAAVRTAVGAYETGVYARYEVSGPSAYAWLDRLLASRLPEVGRIRLAPMLHPNGTLRGDLTVSRIDDDRFWLVGSYYLQEWHQRWFEQQLPPSGVRIENLTDRWLGFAISGPSARELLARVTDRRVDDEAIPFMSCGMLDIEGTRAHVGRISLTGELGYELTVPADNQVALWKNLREAGADLGLRAIGDRAVDSLRLEKGYGVWSREYTQAFTAVASGLDRFIAWDKGHFLGRDAALRERDTGPDQRLVLIAVDADDADALGDEPVWREGRVVGFVTSGAYGHHVERSLALAYLGAEHAVAGADVAVSVVGDRRPGVILAEAPYDPSGSRLRG